MRDRHSVQPANGTTNPLQQGLGTFFLKHGVVEQFNERATVEKFNDELATLVVQIPHRRYGKPGLSCAYQQPRLADHAPDTQAVVKVRVSPRTRPPLFANSRFSKPVAFPDLGLRSEVESFDWIEDHAQHTMVFFLKIHAQTPFEKGCRFRTIRDA